jgi:hypothetical protein
MVPSGPHAAVVPASAYVTVCAEPPRASMRFSSLFMKKPIERLSDDQNGRRAPSVPGSACAIALSSARTHRAGCPSRSATNARLCPSGEIANDHGSDDRGVVISTTRSAGAVAGGRSHQATSAATNASASMAVERPSTRARRRLDAAATAVASASGSLPASSISMRASAM